MNRSKVVRTPVFALAQVTPILIRPPMFADLLLLLLSMPFSAGLILGGALTYLLGVRDPFLIALGACVGAFVAIGLAHSLPSKKRKVVRGGR